MLYRYANFVQSKLCVNVCCIVGSDFYQIPPLKISTFALVLIYLMTLGIFTVAFRPPFLLCGTRMAAEESNRNALIAWHIRIVRRGAWNSNHFQRLCDRDTYY